MLLTEVWEALEGLRKEPPTHILLRPQAAFFGFKFESDPKDKQSPDSDVGQVMNMFGKAKDSAALPGYVRNDPAFQKMVAEMREDNG